ncbi:MAG: SpoIIE family protein phosphatase [Thermoleophilia bacterium]
MPAGSPSRALRLAALRVATLVGAPGLATGAALLLELEGKPGALSIFLIAVLTGATVAGIAGGVVAGALSYLALNWFFLEPYRSFRVHPDDWVVIGVFAVSTVLTSSLIGRLRAARAQEREAREAAERAANRLARVQRLAGALGRALTPTELAAAVVDAGVEAAGSDAGSVCVLDEAGDALDLAGQRGFPDRFARAVRRIPLTSEAGAARVVRERQPLWIRSAEEYAREIPGLSGLYATLGREAVAFLPLESGGRVLGAVAFTYDEPRPFDEDDRALLLLLADQCAQGLERARMFAHERETAVVLQRSMLPTRLPVSESVAVAARYVPAGPGLAVGGDWYDVLELTGGALAVCVGDVVGHGLPAAAVMGQLRNAGRAYALDGLGPADVLGRLDGLLGRVGGGLATCAYAVVDPATGVLRVASAGHPPPLVVGADGAVRVVEDGRGLPLGVGLAGRYTETTIQLAPGDTLVLYTDGLVERRGESLDRGLDRLTVAATRRSVRVEALVEALVEELVAPEPDDDTAVLAVRLLADPSRPRLRLQPRAAPEELAPVRRALGRWLADVGAAPDESAEIVLACCEACSNAIEHPVAPLDPTFQLTAEKTDEAVVVEVRDTGRWRAPAGERPGGRGLELMRALMDGVAIRSEPQGTVVTLERRLADRA